MIHTAVVHEEAEGLAVTSSSDDAVASYRLAVDALLAGRTDVDGFLDDAIDADADMAMAWVLRSLRERVAGRVAESRAALQRAVHLAPSLSHRERTLLAFFDAYNGPDRFETERLGIEHLRAHPRDRLVVQYMHFLYNLQLPTTDRRERHQALAEEHAADWDGDWYLLGERAFIATEAGRHQEARALAERALDARPDNGPAAHAMAHAMLETGATGDGRAWLGQWLEAWGPTSTSACHLVWHHALLALADGEREGVARHIDEILAFAGRTVMALCDGASLMWRLELEGRTAPLPWSALDDAMALPGFPFGTLHRAIVLAGLKRPDAVREEGAAIGGATAHACAALADFIEGDGISAADRLRTHEPDLVTIGGSRAQLEVLEDTLIAALMRSGRRDDAAGRLRGRLARRASARDARWLAAVTAA